MEGRSEMTYDRGRVAHALLRARGELRSPALTGRQRGRQQCLRHAAT